MFETLERSQLGDSVRILENVPDHDLAAFYSMASMLVTPSLYEGVDVGVVSLQWRRWRTVFQLW